MEASDWLLKIVRRNIDDRKSKNSLKRLISLTSWDHCDHIFQSVGKGSEIFGNRRQGKRKKKRGGVGGWGKERKKVGRGGWGRTKKKCGGWGGVGG